MTRPAGRRMRAARAVLAIVFAAGCSTKVGHASERAAPSEVEPPLVVVTTNILGDIAATALGDQVDVRVLMPAGADPHSFAISAAEAEMMSDADLVVANGLGLETAIASNLDAARDAGVPVLEIGPAVDPLVYGPEADDETGRPDPHVWTDPSRMVVATRLIVDAVAELAGVDGDRVRATGDRFVDDLEAMERSMAERLAAVPTERRALVTNHHVLGYFADRFGFEVVGAVIPSGTTLASPSASDLDELGDVMRTTGAPAIFADTSSPARLADALAAELGADVAVVDLYTESLGPPGSAGATYLDMLDTNVERIVAALAPDG